MLSDDSEHLTIPSIDIVDENTIEKIIAIGEGIKTEFKLKIPPTTILARLIAAFANTEGGVILIGIRDDGTIQGIDEKDEDRFFEAVDQAVAEITPHQNFLSCGLRQYKDKQIGVILALHDSQTPLVIKGDFFKRLGSQNLKLDRADFVAINKAIPITNVLKFAKLEINESEIEHFMNISDEDAFCEVLLVPFLRKLKFRSVQRKGHRDKTLEFGQDIRSFKLELPTGHWLYFAAQVKTEDITYSPSKHEGKENIDTVIKQLEMAFGREMFDYETNAKVLPDHVLFVSSGNINEGARDYMEDALSRDKRRKILILKRDTLIECIMKVGLPKGCQIAIRKYIASKEGLN